MSALQPNSPADWGSLTARRHLRWIAVVAAALWAVVIAINGVALQLIAAPENQRVLQNNVGWERSYKPIIHDRLSPKVAVFGASWARDAFDFEEINQLLQRPFFNFAVSGGQPYENRRFLQSALAHGQLQVALLNIDSFLIKPNQLTFQYGFNEGLLNVQPDGQPNPGRNWHRFFATTLSGAAVGNNLAAFSILKKFRQGVPKTTLLRAYDRYDFSADPARMALLRKTLLEGGATGLGEPLPMNAAQWPQQSADLRQAVQTACAAGIEVHLYFTPSHAAFGEPKNQFPLKQQVLQLLRNEQSRCKGRLHYFDFNYPNVVNLEAVLDGARHSRYYRSDGHPRPTVGVLMADVMLGGRRGPAAQLGDFGQDLLALDDPAALDWLRQREARWAGVWLPGDWATVRADIDSQARQTLP